jgi:diguanylate cyclase (GGDEF)-like protein/PAS domain S-box-containing protein
MKINFHLLSNIDLFLKIFNNLTDLVYLIEVDGDGHYRYLLANEPAKKFVGLPDTAFGKLIDDYLPKKVADFIKQKYLEAIEAKGTISYEDKMEITLNHPTYWESKITPIYNTEGDCTHLLVVARDITERKAKQRELKKIKERLELIWNSAADAVFTIDTNAEFVSVNQAFTKLFGWTEEELLSDKSISIIPSHFKEDINEVLDKLKSGETVPSHTVQRITKKGELVDVLASYSPIHEEGHFIGSVVMYKDITEQNKYYKQLQESEERYRLIAEHTSDLIKIVDLEGKISYASPSHYKILGTSPDNYLNQSILSCIHPDERKMLKNALNQIAVGWRSVSLEIRNLNKNGEWIWVDAIGTPVFDSNGKVSRIIFESRDITERKEHEDKLEQLALYDSLTNLPNRVLFTSRLEEEMVRQNNTSLAVMFLDLDNFKQINDTMGHAVGDWLLNNFGKRVNESLRQNDMVARLGGDEFVILLPNLKEQEEAIEIARNIIKSLQNDWEIEGNKFKTTSSIGIAFYNPSDPRNTDLLKKADIALYEAKEKGKNKYQVYRTE